MEVRDQVPPLLPLPSRAPKAHFVRFGEPRTRSPSLSEGGCWQDFNYVYELRLWRTSLRLLTGGKIHVTKTAESINAVGYGGRAVRRAADRSLRRGDREPDFGCVLGSYPYGRRDERGIDGGR